MSESLILIIHRGWNTQINKLPLSEIDEFEKDIVNTFQGYEENVSNCTDCFYQHKQQMMAATNDQVSIGKLSEIDEKDSFWRFLLKSSLKGLV